MWWVGLAACDKPVTLESKRPPGIFPIVSPEEWAVAASDPFDG